MSTVGVILGVIVVLAGGWALALQYGSFACHMLAHVLAVAVAAPVLAFALRWPGWLRTAPVALLACGLELVVVWGWHMPAMHRLAADHAAVFVAEQVMFLAVGVGVWAGVQPARQGARRQGNLVGVAVLLMTSMHMTLLGALLVLAPAPLYHPGATQHGLADQQLGGLVMLIACSTVYLGGAVMMLRRMLRLREVPSGAAS